jgi:hypothetical protein
MICALLKVVQALLMSTAFVSGLAGPKINQLLIDTAKALVSTHKGAAIAMFHQMGLLGMG